MNVYLLHQWNEYLTTGLAIIINMFVVILTVTEQNNSTIRSIVNSRMLIATCMNEFAYCFCSLITVTACEISNGVAIFVTEGIFKNFGATVHYVLFFVYIFKLGIGCNIIPVIYYIRWQTICRKNPPSTKTIVLLIACGWSYAALSAALFVRAALNNPTENARKYAHLLDDMNWKEQNGRPPTFVCIEYSDLLLPFLFAVFGVNGAFILAVNWGLKIYRQLNSVKHLMTKRTIRLQHSTTIMLLIQAIFPFLCSALPVSVFVVAMIFHSDIMHFGIYTAMLSCYLPIITPFATIFLISVFRRRLLKLFRCSRTKNVKITQIAFVDVDRAMCMMHKYPTTKSVYGNSVRSLYL